MAWMKQGFDIDTALILGGIDKIGQYSTHGLVKFPRSRTNDVSKGYTGALNWHEFTNKGPSNTVCTNENAQIDW